MRIITKPVMHIDAIDIATGRIVDTSDPKEKWTALTPGKATWGNVIIEFDERLDMNNIEIYDTIEDDEIELTRVFAYKHIEGTVYECKIDWATIKNPLI